MIQTFDSKEIAYKEDENRYLNALMVTHCTCVMMQVKQEMQAFDADLCTYAKLCGEGSLTVE